MVAKIGEHTDELLADWLSLDDAQIDALEADGVIREIVRPPRNSPRRTCAPRWRLRTPRTSSAGTWTSTLM